MKRRNFEIGKSKSISDFRGTGCFFQSSKSHSGSLGKAEIKALFPMMKMDMKQMDKMDAMKKDEKNEYGKMGDKMMKDNMKEHKMKDSMMKDDKMMEKSMNSMHEKKDNVISADIREIYLAGGCFWGVEAYMERIYGVVDAVSGYANGKQKSEV